MILLSTSLTFLIVFLFDGSCFCFLFYLSESRAFRVVYRYCSKIYISGSSSVSTRFVFLFLQLLLNYWIDLTIFSLKIISYSSSSLSSVSCESLASIFFKSVIRGRTTIGQLLSRVFLNVELIPIFFITDVEYFGKDSLFKRLYIRFFLVL